MREKPISSMANPACMNSTRIAATITHMVFTATVSPSVPLMAWARSSWSRKRNPSDSASFRKSRTQATSGSAEGSLDGCRRSAWGGFSLRSRPVWPVGPLYAQGSGLALRHPSPFSLASLARPVTDSRRRPCPTRLTAALRTAARADGEPVFALSKKQHRAIPPTLAHALPCGGGDGGGYRTSELASSNGDRCRSASPTALGNKTLGRYLVQRPPRPPPSPQWDPPPAAASPPRSVPAISSSGRLSAGTNPDFIPKYTACGWWAMIATVDCSGITA